MRLLIVDDHEVVRRGVRSLLSEQTGYEICGEAVDGQDALQQAGKLKPDLIVMDVSMPRLNGLEATRQVRSMLPDCEVLILSQHESSEMARQALKAGARGYVVKTAISRDLVSAIGKVSRREYFFDPAILDHTPSMHTDVQEVLQRSAAFEKALRESEQRLRKLAAYQSAVMNNMAEGLYALDANGLVTSMNRAGEAILGWKTEELLGKKMHDVTHYKHPDGRPYPADECPGLQVVQRGRALREYEDTFIHKDGSLVPVVFSASPLKEDGKIAGVIVSFRNDAEQRRAREALFNAKRELQESQDQLALALESSRTAMFDWDVAARRGKWNAQMAAIYEFKPQGAYITTEEWRRLFHPEDAERLTKEAERVWKEGQEFTFEFRTVRRNGEVRWMLSHGRIVRDGSGKAVRMIGTHADITESKLQEAERRKSEQRFRAFFESSAIGVVRAEVPSARFLDVNDTFCRMTGYTREELRKLTVFDVTAAEDRQLTEEAVEKLRTNGASTFTADKRYVRKDGTPFWAHTAVNLVAHGDGEPAYTVAVITDINDRKRMEEGLRSSAIKEKALFHLADELHRADSLDGVYNAALNAMLDALQCHRASILLCDPAGAMRFRAWRGLSKHYRAGVNGHSAWKPDEPDPKPVCIADVDAADLPAPLKDVVRTEGIAALAFIPLLSDGKLIGKFMVYFNAPHAFSEGEIELSLTIARQLAFAIERMRATDALRQSRNQLARESEALRKLNDASSRLWQMRNLRQGLEEILSATIDLLGADKGTVQLFDPHRRVLTIAAQRGFEQEFLDFFREVSVENESACGRALREGGRAVIEDVERDAAYAPYRNAARAAGYCAVISAPLAGKSGSPLGILSVHFASPHRPSNEDLRRLDLYVGQASDFIQRCKMDQAPSEQKKGEGGTAAAPDAKLSPAHLRPAEAVCGEKEEAETNSV